MRYKSVSTGESCTAAQLIAELMVIREAKKKGVTLTGHWWNDKTVWQKKYKQQIIAANGLLKIYDASAILNAIQKRKELAWCYSLRYNGLNDLFKEEQDKLDKIKESAEQSEREFNTATTTEIKKFGRQSKLDKLRD